MSQRVALLVSAVLAAITLIAGAGLAVRVLRGDVAIAADGDSSGADTATAADDDRERVYREAFDSLQEANAALVTSYQRIAALLDTVEQLRQQNAELRDREALYQQRLAEANDRLQRQGQAAVEIPPTAQLDPDRQDVQAQQRSDHAHD